MLALSACAATQAHTAPPSASAAPVLADTNWRYVELDGKPIANPKTRLTFTGDRLSTNLGCNTSFGPWTIEDQRLVTGALAQTKMFCRGEAMGHDGLVAVLLAAKPTITISGDTLTLQGGDHSAKLERAPAEGLSAP